MKIMIINRDHIFCRTRNFEPSCGICPFPWNFAEFVLAGDMRTNMAYLGGV